MRCVFDNNSRHSCGGRALFQLKMCENLEGHSGTVRLGGLVILRHKNGQAKKLNPEQIVEDLVVLKTHKMTFRQVSTTTNSLMVVTLGVHACF